MADTERANDGGTTATRSDPRSDPVAESEPSLVSVVTPVYNGAEHLAECIESVMAQSYENWEYVIVDNCSTDESVAIAERYAARERRIRVHRNEEFLSALENFNHMLRQIHPESEYCKVVHADDWLFPDCLRKMVAVAVANPSVGIVSSYRLVGDTVQSDGLPYDREVFSGSEIARMNLTQGPYTFGNPSALLIRSDLIRANDPFYNEEHPGADTEACLNLLQESDFGFVHQVLSFMRDHPDSITSGIRYFGTNHPNYLYSYKKFGPRFLPEREYERHLQRLVRAYYQFLGRHPRRLMDREFVEYHRDAMERIGMRLSWPRIAGAAVRAGLVWLIDLRGHLRSLVQLAERAYGRTR